jgi:hypothetical protein
MNGIRRVSAALLGTALLTAGPASAADGTVSSRRFAPLPDPLVVRVEAGDDGRASLAARDAFVAALRQRGVKLTSGSDATLVLRLDSEVRNNIRGGGGGGGRMSDGGSGMPAYDQPSTRLGAEDSGDRSTNLFSVGPGMRQQNDAIIRRDPRASQDYDRGLRYVVNVSGNETATGRFVWQGNVRWDGIAADDAAGLARIAPRLAPLLGTSLAATGFDLD